MTVKEIRDRWMQALTPLYGPGEARAVTDEVIESFLGMSKVDVVLNGTRALIPETDARFEQALNQLLAGKPVQYITGEAWFHGLRLKVTPAVLIPRKETSQLVDIIAKDFAGRSDLRVIDLCSGSGAIGLALARQLPFSRVTAVELSPDALEIARQNDARLRTRITFIEADVLNPANLPTETFDIIVSNPPYIPLEEISEVDSLVKDNEPSMALFVPNDEPLLFYRAISRWAVGHLADGGRLYFEINPRFASSIIDILRADGFGNAFVEKDFANKNRFITAWR